jgi:sugar phosphate isomerase/epimerase
VADFWQEAQRLGCWAVELNHQVTMELLDEARALHAQGRLLVSSVHDPCPTRPGGLGVAPQLSAADEGERREAVRHTVGTVELAAALGARAVVVHAGRVDIPAEREHEVRQRWRTLGLARAVDDPEYGVLLRELLDERERRREMALQAVEASLEEIGPIARQLGVSLGLENRYFVLEIPALDEVDRLTRACPPGTAFYWHDTGHAQVLANLGVTPHEAWLDRYRDITLGCHLHDVTGLDDHQPPGQGSIDFAWVLRQIPSTALKVVEVAPRFDAERLALGLDHLRRAASDLA